MTKIIDNSKQYKTSAEQLAYHQGWMDGMNNSQRIREEVEKEEEKANGKD